MKKNVLMVVLVVMLAIMSVAEIASMVYAQHVYTVEQFRFNDGYTITIDWHEIKNEYGVKYRGCINDGQRVDFYIWPAHVWGRRLLEHSDGKDSAEYCATLTEWRW